VITTGKMPLILQHQGHSRTIIGYEVQKSGAINLLLFDPSRRPKHDLRTAALACMPSPLLENDRNHSFSPSRLMHKVLHPHDGNGDNSRKRRGSNSLYSEDVKRVRGGLAGNSVDELFVGGEDRERENPKQSPTVAASEEKLDPVKVINFFRVNPSKLKKNDRYQILYFPLEEPLEEEQRWQYRVITSERVD